MLRAILILVTFLIISSCQPDEKPIYVAKSTPFLNIDTHVTDSTLQSMTLDEKIGQLFLVKANYAINATKASVNQWVKEGIVGGVMLNNLPIGKYKNVIDSLNLLSEVPLFNATDQKVLINNQFSDVVQFPLPPSIGCIKNDTIQKELETLFVNQCNALGINFCISPPASRFQKSEKVFPNHLFESDSLTQLNRSRRLIEQLDKQKILSIGDRFSEYYQIENDTSKIIEKRIEHQSFLADIGLSGFLLDESIFQVDSVERYPIHFLKNYLKKHADFDGLIIGEISNEVSLDELLYAGTDIFIASESVNVWFEKIKRKVLNNEIPESIIDEKVSKILLAKSYIGIDDHLLPVDEDKIEKYLKHEYFKFNADKLFENSITLAQNNKDLLPFTQTYKRDFRIINVGNDKLKIFKEYFAKYANFKSYNRPPESSGTLKPLRVIFHKHSTSVVVLDNIELDSMQHRDFIKSINELSESSKLTVVNYGNPLNLEHFQSTMSLIQVFEKNKITESIVPQILFGGTYANGQLPVSINSNLRYGKSIRTPITRLKYTTPEDVGISPEKLVGIDAIMKAAINKRATPGAQILVAKNGKVFYSKSFGHHTYDKKQKVRNSDLFDLASITKVAATSIGMMKMFDGNKFKLKDKIRDKFDLRKKSRIGRATFKQLLTHSSGLQANIPISDYYRNKEKYIDGCNDYFCTTPDEDYNIRIADSMYFNHNWLDTLWGTVQNLKLKRRGRFKYSDANFYILKRFIEQESKLPLDDYMSNYFYKRLNLRRLTYNPLKRFKPKHIIPTERDKRWRKQLIRGYVHDEGASLEGGVGGHSGLFSNSNDLAILFQMLLNGGTYGDMKYVKSKTIKDFTTPKHGNHRGLGFVVKGRRGANSISKKAPGSSYGHTGFTGTCVWVDPKNELIYIFLSSRIHPRKENTRLFKRQVRRRIHDVIYKSLDTFKKENKKEERLLTSL